MSTVSAAAALGSLVNLDALDNKVASVETLGVGVGLSVLEEVDQELGGLDGPAGLGDTELLAWKRELSAGCSITQIPHIEFSFSNGNGVPEIAQNLPLIANNSSACTIAHCRKGLRIFHTSIRPNRNTP